MLEVTQFPFGKAITETSKVLAGRKHAIPPAVLRFSSAAALRAFLDAGTTPDRPDRIAALGDLALTGMSREDLASLTGRLSAAQAAEAGARKYLQRGGHNTARRAGAGPQ